MRFLAIIGVKRHFGSFWGPNWGFSVPWGPTICMPLCNNVIEFPQFISNFKSYIVYTILDPFLGRNWCKKAFLPILGPKTGSSGPKNGSFMPKTAFNLVKLRLQM